MEIMGGYGEYDCCGKYIFYMVFIKVCNKALEILQKNIIVDLKLLFSSFIVT